MSLPHVVFHCFSLFIPNSSSKINTLVIYIIIRPNGSSPAIVVLFVVRWSTIFLAWYQALQKCNAHKTYSLWGTCQKLGNSLLWPPPTSPPLQEKKKQKLASKVNYSLSNWKVNSKDTKKHNMKEKKPPLFPNPPSPPPGHWPT
jgi:hypothetical protein